MRSRTASPLASFVVSALTAGALLAPPSQGTAYAATSTPSGGPSGGSSAAASSTPAISTPDSTARAGSRVRSVLLISVDGLTPASVATLGRKRTPHLHRLMARGTSTRNARTAVELTTTLPNHTGMLTGRRIDAETGGHGVRWNDDRREPATVHQAAGHRVASLFTRVDSAGRRTALFAGKTKFTLHRRSWGKSIDRFRVRTDDGRLAKDVTTDLRRKKRALRFWHIATPDRAGHAHGFSSKAYLRAVQRTDRMIGRAVRTLRTTPRLRGKVAIVLTSDHGSAGGKGHGDADRLGNQKIFFIAQGPGIAAGADFYRINPDTVANPGRQQPAYDADLPPVRNGDAANFVLDLLGLPPVPGSEFNKDQHLKWVRP